MQDQSKKRHRGSDSPVWSGKPTNEIQNDDITLPGGLGTVVVAGVTREITQFFAKKDGSVTLTIGADALPEQRKLPTLKEKHDFEEKVARIKAISNRIDQK